MDVGVEMEGGMARGGLAVCEELVSNSGRRCGVKPIGGKACGGTQVGTGGVLVAHMALAGMLDLFYLRVATRFSTCITPHASLGTVAGSTSNQPSSITPRFLCFVNNEYLLVVVGRWRNLLLLPPRPPAGFPVGLFLITL